MFRFFDLDDGRPEVPQHHCGQGPGEHPAEVGNDEARQGTWRVGCIPVGVCLLGVPFRIQFRGSPSPSRSCSLSARGLTNVPRGPQCRRARARTPLLLSNELFATFLDESMTVRQVFSMERSRRWSEHGNARSVGIPMPHAPELQAALDVDQVVLARIGSRPAGRRPLHGECADLDRNAS